MDEIVALLVERFGDNPDYPEIIEALTADRRSGELPDRFQRLLTDRIVARSRARYIAQKES